jgi:hypothetical protein
VEPSTTSTHCAQAYTGATFSNDQYSDVTYVAQNTTGDYTYPIVRAQTATNSWYEAVIHGVLGTLVNVQIFKAVSGVETAIGPGVGITVNSGDVVRLQVIGNVITVFLNGFQMLQVEDPNNTLTAGKPGIHMYATSAITNNKVGPWSGGNAGVLPKYPTSQQITGWID